MIFPKGAESSNEGAKIRLTSKKPPEEEFYSDEGAIALTPPLEKTKGKDIFVMVRPVRADLR